MRKRVRALHRVRGAQTSPFVTLAAAVLARAAVDCQSVEHRLDVKLFITSGLCGLWCDLASVNREVYARRIRFLCQG